MVQEKLLLRALAGETLPVPPIWMMRQAGRYLPEYKATRAQAGDFLSLCYNPELAAEVTLQPIRRYSFDAAILFADILLLPQAMGADLWFVTGEGPRLSTITTADQLKALKPLEDIHETLNPIYETVKILKNALPKDTTLIGFAAPYSRPLSPRLLTARLPICPSRSRLVRRLSNCLIAGRDHCKALILLIFRSSHSSGLSRH